ncbi:MAG: GtrA family protein [Saprospiraceae bacterium]
MSLGPFLLKFVKFGLVGVTGAFIDFGLTFLLKNKMRLNKYVANSTGFMCAVLNNYLLNRWWTFENQDPQILPQFFKFLMIALVGLALNNWIIYYLHQRLKLVGFWPAKVIATCIVVLWNFGANLAFTFRPV